MMSFCIIFLLISACISPFVRSSENYSSINSLDAFLQDSALTTFTGHRPAPRTGALYKARLPANVSGIAVSVVRIRSRRLWNVGANFSNILIPPRTQTVPHVKRLAIVYEDMGNWSSHYYNVPGYTMLTSVVGFKVFNASNAGTEGIKKVGLDTKGKFIAIRFSLSTIPESKVSIARCAAFNTNGTFHFSELDRSSVCYAKHQGHFSVVVPVEGIEGNQRKDKHWYLWLIGFVLGFCGLLLVGYFVVISMKLLMTKKIQVMERQADEDLVLQALWVGNSKMPSATLTRTQPVLETGGFPLRS